MKSVFNNLYSLFVLRSAFSLCVILFLFGGIFETKAQQHIVDSLLVELQKNPDRNTSRVKLLNELAYYYSFLNPDEGIKKAEEAIDISQSLDNSVLATSFSRKAINLNAASKDSIALVFYDKAFDLRQDAKEDLEMAKILYNKGLIYFNRAEYQKANQNNHKAYSVFEKRKDSFLMAKMQNSIGINHMYLAEYPKALSAYTNASLLFENLKQTDHLEYGAILTNIGLLYEKFEDFILAKEYQEKAIHIFKTIDYTEGIANCLTNLGNLYRNESDFDKAISSYKEALLLMKRIDNKKGIANARTNIGITAITIHQYEKAIEQLETTRRIYSDLGDDNNLSIVEKNLGVIAHRKGQTQRSITYLKNAVQLAEKAENLKAKHSALEELTTVYFAKKDYKNAYLIQQEAHHVKSLFSSQNQKEAIARLETKYIYEKERIVLQNSFEKEQAIAQEEIKRQRSLKRVYLWVISIISLILGFSFFLWKQKQKAETQRKVADFQKEIATIKLKMFRAQMSPHFIFNSLNSIRDYVLKNDKKTASNYLSKFAKVMRQTLENSQIEEISLDEEIEFLKAYLYLEKKRLKNTFEYTIEVDKTIEIDNTLVPPLLLQPFVENSIWHGISKKEGTGYIKISFSKGKDMLLCTVDDNGIGLKQKENELIAKNSLGINITKSRLDVLNKLKNTAAQIAIFDKKESLGVRVEIKLPLLYAF